jgi:putative pyoverdin transport system ATP-binding/permease protein
VDKKITFKNRLSFGLICFVSFLLLSCIHFYGSEADDSMASIKSIEEKVGELIDKGDIPGLTLVILRPDQPDYIKGFGIADNDTEAPVTEETLFEIASCSKSYTGLAAAIVLQQGLINLKDPVTKYLPYFKPTFEGEPQEITLEQFLHHTSGFPFSAVQFIPLEDEENALEKTVRNLKDRELEFKPGTRFNYATVNYDVIGHVIEKVTGMSYEEFMKKNVFDPLGLSQTFVGMKGVPSTLEQYKSKGHKIGFFAARRYDAPPYTGNNPAGYIVTNGKDMAKWLKYQLGILDTPLRANFEMTHRRDESVPPAYDLSSYGMGWQVSLTGNGYIYHSGLNPNYTSMLMFNPKSRTAVAVMANSNSNYTGYIGRIIMDRLHGSTEDADEPRGALDKSLSVISILVGLYILAALLFILSIFFDLLKKKRAFEPMTGIKLAKILGVFPMVAPFIVGIYLLPKAIINVSWETAWVWSPVSFKTTIFLILCSFGVTFIGYAISLLFPQKNEYLRSMPMLVILSILSGGANAVVIFLISGAIMATDKQRLYMLFFFMLAMGLYIIGRKIIQTKLIKITYKIVYDVRMKLLEKVFHTSYQKFESMERGRVFATLNDDTNQMGQSANLIVTLLSNIVTVIGCFIFLSTVAFWATVVTVVVIAFIATLYSFVSQKAQVYMEEARDTRNVYMGLLNGMLDGFKELSIQFKKKKEYNADLEETTNTFREKMVLAQVKFLNAFMIGESMLVAVMGAVGFLVPKLFPSIQALTLMSFIMVLLYLIGPITGILISIPQIMQLRISWNRVKTFMDEIPANITPEELEKLDTDVREVKKVQAKNVLFQYESVDGDTPFVVGPIDFEAQKGEIVFIIGGNGSGKTTFAKLLTGLYMPHDGKIMVDGNEVSNHQLGECYSAVFSDFHLFEKLYNVDLKTKKEDAENYLKALRLEEKVAIDEKGFNTIDLSGGQRKRLALLQCYLENKPIYLFDEMAADQDPEFRKFFYRDLLVRMKEEGKIVIAITHDDHYFDVADKVIKLDMGKVDVITEGKTQLSVTR